jgi:O-antigen/teichoic acid export membrane protein
MSIVPGALARAVFPLFSGNQESSLEIASRAYKGLLLATAVVALPVLAGAEMLLDVWLGQPYGSESASVLRILVIGFVFNSIAQIPFSRIQAHGHSKLTAVIHLVELGPYLMLLAGLVYLFGIQGAAMAWSLRVTADFIALEYFSRKMGV